MANINFDANEVAPDQVSNFEPIPDGWYEASIVSAEMLHGSKPDAGEMLKLQVEINGNEHPQYSRRREFTYLCINHKRDTPRNIAQRHLSSICHAIKQLELDDTDQLLGESLQVRLKLRPASNGYEAGNDIAQFAPSGSQKTTEAPKPTVSATENSPVGVAQRSWK